MAEYTCLIIDDSQTMRQMLVHALSRLSQLQIVQASDGVEGLRKLAVGHYDLIVTDLNMPLLDGLKLIRHIRADAVHKEIPIIVITTEGSAEDRNRALQLGANAYVTKPLQAAQVLMMVREMLGIV